MSEDPALEIPPGRLLSVNVGRAKAAAFQGRSFRTAIEKRPVDGLVAVRDDHVGDDQQADRRHHGGREQAVYAYSTEDTGWWAERLSRPLVHGTFGENLTTQGVDVSGALIGERWRIGTVLLEVSGPRIPCRNLAAHMGDAGFVRRFVEAGRPGAYFRILVEGELEAGDEIRVVERPDRSLSIREVYRIRTQDHDQAERLLGVPALAVDSRKWAETRLASRERGT